MHAANLHPETCKLCHCSDEPVHLLGHGMLHVHLANVQRLVGWVSITLNCTAFKLCEKQRDDESEVEQVHEQAD